MPQPRALVALTSLFTVGLLALSGCHSNTPASNLPDGSTLVSQASTAMTNVQSAHITIDTSGKVGTIPLRTAEGDLKKGGDAKGSIKLLALGQVIQLDFVVVGDNFYIKGLTGGWQKASAAEVATFYDPSGILDPSRGVAKVLATATDARTEAAETVNGVNTYRVAVNLDNTVVSTVVPDTPTGTTGKVWLDQNTKRLVKAELDVSAAGGGPGTVTINLTDLDKPVTIDAPI
jgi:lipoprotein LprG